MSSQPTLTQMTPGLSNGPGKKRRINDETDQHENERNVDDQGENSEDDDDTSDGELTREEILEQKRMRASKNKVLTQIRHRDEGIGKVAAKHPVPKAATPLARAIHEFTRMLMGIPRKSRTVSAFEDASVPKLPEPPSDAERHAWETRKQVRELFIREAQDKAMQRYLSRKPSNFKPNRKQRKMVENDAADMATLKSPMQPVIFTSRISASGRSRYAHHFVTQCEASLAMAGFPRCTFDWLASYDSPWNSAMSSIILSHWSKTYDANGARQFGILTKDNTAANREEVFRRWCGGKAVKYREQTRNCELVKTPVGQKKLKDNIEIAKSITSKRLNKTKLYEARLAQAVRLFGKNSLELEMLSNPEIHSDDELVTTHSSGSRQKLRLEWRSAELDTLINLLDQCHHKRKTLPKDRRMAKQLVDRGVYRPTPDEDKFPPKGFQLSLISPSWYAQQEGLVISELELDETNPLNITSSIQEVLNSFKTMASLSAEMSAENSSNLMMSG